MTFVILNLDVDFLTDGDMVESECISSLLGGFGGAWVSLPIESGGNEETFGMLPAGEALWGDNEEES